MLRRGCSAAWSRSVRGGRDVRAHEVSFRDLVQGEKQFQVPLYQRTYSWGSKQLAQLWPHAKFRLLENAGHFFPVSRPHEVISCCERFWANAFESRTAAWQ